MRVIWVLELHKMMAIDCSVPSLLAGDFLYLLLSEMGLSDFLPYFKGILAVCFYTRALGLDLSSIVVLAKCYK